MIHDDRKTAKIDGGNGGNDTNTAKIDGGNGGRLSDAENIISKYLEKHPDASQKEISEDTGFTLRTVQRILPELQKKGILVREGSRRYGTWKVIESQGFSYSKNSDN